MFDRFYLRSMKKPVYLHTFGCPEARSKVPSSFGYRPRKKEWGHACIAFPTHELHSYLNDWKAPQSYRNEGMGWLGICRFSLKLETIIIHIARFYSGSDTASGHTPSQDFFNIRFISCSNFFED